MLILKPWYSPGANAQFKQLMEINTNFQGRHLPASALAMHTFPPLNQCSISRGRETITWNAQRLHLLGCRAEECTTKQQRAEPLLEIIVIIRVPLHWVEKSLVKEWNTSNYKTSHRLWWVSPWSEWREGLNSSGGNEKNNNLHNLPGFLLWRLLRGNTHVIKLKWHQLWTSPSIIRQTVTSQCMNT